MIDDFSIDRTATLHDIQQLMTAMNTDSLYVKPEEYRRLIGMGRTQFMNLKKLGRFDRGTHKATLGGRFILIHRNFNMYSQKIELPENDAAIASKRGKNMTKPKKTKQQETLLSSTAQYIGHSNQSDIASMSSETGKMKNEQLQACLAAAKNAGEAGIWV